ncbi:MAG: hypothetical protein AAGH79_12325 [Bacteroidota bacterium]
MKKLTCGICLLLHLSLAAQADLSFSLQQGYIHNIFRNPASWNPSGDESLPPTQLLQSGAVTAAEFTVDWEKKWKQQRLGFASDIGGQFFPSLQPANEVDISLKQSFEHRFTKKLTGYQKGGWRVKNRQGSDVAEDLFTLPNAYRQLDYLVGLSWRPNRAHWLKLEIGKSHKIYQPTETSSLRYDATQFRLLHRYRFDNKDHLQRWTTTLKYQRRWYERERFLAEETEEEEDLEAFNLYDMQYLVFDTELSYDLGEDWTLSPSLEWTRRQSEEDRLQYWQLEPSLKVGYQKEKWEVNGRTVFAYRKNPFLEPGETELPLIYGYATFAGNVQYEWKERWCWTASWSFTKRWSSFDEVESRAYRPYGYWRILAGLRYRF